jgi:hypothetical protein
MGSPVAWEVRRVGSHQDRDPRARLMGAGLATGGYGGRVRGERGEKKQP